MQLWAKFEILCTIWVQSHLIFFQSLHLVIAHDVKQEVVLTGNNEIDKQVGKKELHHSCLILQFSI